MTYLQRKKLAFMSIVNSVKGFVRKVSGIPPLTLPSCVDAESLIDYTIEGASGGVGELTENLFDNKRNWSGTGGNAIPSYGGYLVQKLDGGGYHLGSHSSVSFVFNNLVAGETYTLSYILTADAKGTTTNMIYIGSAASYVHCYSQGSWKTVTKTFTVDDSGSITFKFGISNSNGGGNDLGGTITELMLVQGSTAKAYEPYGKYQLPIVCSGKNLFDYDSRVWEMGYTLNPQDGLSATNVNYRVSDYIEILKPETTYTVSFMQNFDTASATTNRICCYDKDKKYLGYADIATSGVKRYSYSITTPLKTKYIRLATRKTDTEIQIEYGGVASSYEAYVTPTTTNIYLDEPLEDGEVINYKEDNLPTLHTVQGTTIYTVETAVQPSNMIVTYYATAKE